MDSPDRRAIDSELPRSRDDAGDFPNLSNLFGGKATSAVAVANGLALLRDHVGHVVVVRAQEQVIWIDACAVVAAMQNAKTGRNWPAMDFPRYAMSECPFAAPAQPSISLARHYVPEPQPAAAIGLGNGLAFDDGSRVLLHVANYHKTPIPPRFS